MRLLELVEEEAAVEHDECREKRDGAVGESGTVDVHVVLSWHTREMPRFDQPWKTETQQDVEGIRPNRITNTHTTMTCATQDIRAYKINTY